MNESILEGVYTMTKKDRYQELKDHASEVAEKQYEVSDYKKNDTLSKGIAETHEQISDDYMSGNNLDTFIRDGKDLADRE
jgi:hypothetical protein